MDLLKDLKQLEADVEFQVKFAEMAKTHNISISKDQGYTVLGMTKALIESIEEERKNGGTTD